MSLDLDGQAILDPDVEVELKSAFTIMEEIDDWLIATMDVLPFPKPSNEPPDLSALVERADDLTDTELATYLMLFTQWASFFDYRLSVVSASHSLAERNRKLIDSKLTLELYAQNVPAAKAQIKVRDQPLHIKFESEELTLYCMKKILTARYKAYSKQADTISRLISLREQELERQRRNSNVGNRGKPRPRPGTVPFR